MEMLTRNFGIMTKFVPILFHNIEYKDTFFCNNYSSKYRLIIMN